ncbi:hypothetical protein HPB48_014686 [Haemaphysalis longicornis]|uniref:Uncharacterized protein n=1 Tax=Haemaphysalis longicornis TaxID=44386 RepID=A0A9J6G6M7_HAELO|nr:hypothetical protein HPB48_014686 [Haemaphysalis longicornis]
MGVPATTRRAHSYTHPHPVLLGGCALQHCPARSATADRAGPPDSVRHWNPGVRTLLIEAAHLACSKGTNVSITTSQSKQASNTVSTVPHATAERKPKPNKKKTVTPARGTVAHAEESRTQPRFVMMMDDLAKVS